MVSAPTALLLSRSVENEGDSDMWTDAERSRTGTGVREGAASRYERVATMNANREKKARQLSPGEPRHAHESSWALSLREQRGMWMKDERKREKTSEATGDTGESSD